MEFDQSFYGNEKWGDVCLAFTYIHGHGYEHEYDMGISINMNIWYWSKILEYNMLEICVLITYEIYF